MANDKLQTAKSAKNDEFYTQYVDVEKEMNAYIDYNPEVFKNKTILLPCDDPEWSNFTKYFAQNFQRFGLRKVISTSYAVESKKYKVNYQPSLFEEENEKFDIDKTRIKGKIFILERDINNDQKINIDDLEWNYLEGDGDFRSEEVKKLRDESDIIITNPPFSLFREFIAWVLEAEKKFAVIGNMNAITYKEIFPLIKENKIWLDNPFVRGAGYFTSPLELNKNLSYFKSHDYREGFIRVPGVRWFTNLEHGRRHQPLSLMTMADNIKFSRHKEIKDIGYNKYNNFDAIEVPFTDSIPDDYTGVMGVPISFLDKYCPEQFEIIGTDSPYYIDELGIKPMGEKWIEDYRRMGGTGHLTANMHSLCLYDANGNPQSVYKRILIKRKR
ncbi:MAG: adenine-specific methyltransferase EcoRI family protein [Treponema sp.]|nr:adenine-specific methyltransferase EcoRI family protein [Treponema sp.]